MRVPLLLGCPGCGSAIVECAFALAGLPLVLEDVDYSVGSPTRERLLAVNPLGQVPALVFPDGAVLTESLAILHAVNDLAPGAGLIPSPGDPQRAKFYRWFAFLVAAVYPTYTYGDDPGKWVPGKPAAKALRESTDRHRIALLDQLEATCGAPWFLGEPFSAIDLYLAVMSGWRPGGRWWAANVPKLHAASSRARSLPAVAPVIARHFG